MPPAGVGDDEESIDANRDYGTGAPGTSTTAIIERPIETEAEITRKAKFRRLTDAFERKKAAAATRSAAAEVEDAARLHQALNPTDMLLPDVANLAINADGAPTPAISLQGGVDDEQLTMAELYAKYANDDASRAAPIEGVDATISGEGVVETPKQKNARRARERRADKKAAAAIMQGADGIDAEPMQTDDPIETPLQRRNRLRRLNYARKRDEQTPEARKASKDRRNAAAKADRAARTAEEKAAANAARQAKMTAEQRSSHAAANQVANMSEDRQEAHRSANQVANMSAERLETRRATDRVVNMPEERQEAHRAANRVVNMPEERQEAHRAANRVVNMPEERQEAHRAANQVANMTEEAVARQNERAAHRRELLHADHVVPPLANEDDHDEPQDADQQDGEPNVDPVEDQELWPLPVQHAPEVVNVPQVVLYRGRYRLEDIVEANAPKNDCGHMTVPCQYGCGALLWPNEGTTNCCCKGTVRLGELPAVPALLQDLFTDRTQRGRAFMSNVRAYNTNLAFVSVGATINDDIEAGPAPFTYRLHGQMIHKIGTLLPRGGVGDVDNASFLQMYLYDGEQAANRRASVMSGLDHGLLLDLHQMMIQVNPYVAQIRQAHAMFLDNPPVELQLRLTNVSDDADVDQRQYNLPTVQEVAAIMPADNEGENRDYRDIVVTTRTRGLHRIKEVHSAYEPLTYPLLFPHGSNGWTYTRTHVDGVKKMTQLEYAAARLAVRHRADGTVSIFHAAGRLLHQYAVDMFHCIESDRLAWARNNQAIVRGDHWRSVRDHVDNGDAAEDTGRGVILQSSFVGGRRYMDEKFRDSMAVVAKYGSPDLFITMTCNPAWEEIMRELLPGQQASDRPDLTSRVFARKLARLIHVLTKLMWLGVSIATIYVIEFQKRGLPHAHIVVFLRHDCKFFTPEDIDSVVSAEIPDPATHPRLHDIVKRCMVHGPCGEAYAHLHPKCGTTDQPNKCSAYYPKEFADVTTSGKTASPEYKRPNNGRTITVGQGRKKSVVDNRFIVPYNARLLLEFDCHINVEVTTGVRSVKYLFKYLSKGQPLITAELTVDRTPQPPVQQPPPADAPAQQQPPPVPPVQLPPNADHGTGAPGPSNAVAQQPLDVEATVAPVQNVQPPRRRQPVDEITTYITGRYLCAYESVWRIFKHHIHFVQPNVVRLPIHLEGEQPVQYSDDQEMLALAEGPPPFTELMGWMAINAEHPETRYLLFADFVTVYRWNKSFGIPYRWTKRRVVSRTVGRLYQTTPAAGERHYLKLCLLNIPGATSFADLRTVNGVVHDAFFEACMALHLIENDNEWRRCLQESALKDMPRAMRELFATILLFGPPAEPLELFNEFADDLCEDYLRDVRRDNPHAVATQEMCERALRQIDRALNRGGRSLANFRNMPIPPPPPEPMEANDVADVIAVDNVAHLHKIETLNTLQSEHFHTITESVNTSEAVAYFLYCAGGTGKTHLLNVVADEARLQGHGVIVVASSGVAALCLKDGRTAHSAFRIPIRIHESSTCSIDVMSAEAQRLRESRLIIWDETTMANKLQLMCVDRLLRDVMRTPQGSDGPIFGGKTVVFGGDFRQVLPVALLGGMAAVLNLTMKKWTQWRKIKILKLEENMRILRLNGNPEDARKFCEFLLSIGDGTVPEVLDKDGVPHIRLDNDMVVGSVDELINHTFPDFDEDTLKGNIILAPRNRQVDDINDKVLKLMPGPAREFLSFDSVDEEGGDMYPIEYLNAIAISGLPLHKLTLKVGCPVMLCRNLPQPGLRNGTRMIVKAMHDHVIEVVIITGSHAGDRALIPRLRITPTDNDLGFTLSRTQFPIRVCFGCTINKSQSQTLVKVGVYLPTPVFSHGQLYVAFSRVGRFEDIKVFVAGGGKLKGKALAGTWTRNVVWKEALRG